MSASLRYRQVHLDFHTSEDIEGIGRKFDPGPFAETLSAAHVDSVTCFARCHHGLLYYPSKAFPERVHPHLERPNLLGDQIEACHERDIRVPIYITVQWDYFTARQHPEWLTRDENGVIEGTQEGEAGFYRFQAVNSPYLDFLKAQTREVLEMFSVDGLFFDIVQPRTDYSEWTRKQMEEEGIDMEDPHARAVFGAEVIQRFKLDMTAFVRQFNSECTIFYNAGHIGPRIRRSIDAYTHLELESLPSAQWGYLHFPATVRYARNLGLDSLGMTGKFHTSWGDFHSFKNREALAFESFQALAFNAKCSIGDQLHPSGVMCPYTYRLIGSVFAEVEAKEPWCRGAEPLTEMAIMTPEEFERPGDHVTLPESVQGAVRILQEGHHQFDVVDSASDLSKYRLLILPDDVPGEQQVMRKIDSFLDEGGSLILSHRSGVNPAGNAFASDRFCVDLVGAAPFSPDFLFPREKIRGNLPPTAHVMYEQGTEVEPRLGAEILADVEVPYFNRTAEHFCSHAHTPSSGEYKYPGVVQDGSVIYFAHPIFTQYCKNAPKWCKELVLNAVRRLFPDPLVQVDCPSSMIVTLNRQVEEDRLVVHLLHYIPERRGERFDIVEDAIPLYDIRFSIRDPNERIESIFLEPRSMAIVPVNANGRTRFTVPFLQGHQIVSLQLKSGRGMRD